MKVKSVSAGVVRNGRFSATAKKVAKKNPLPTGRFVPAKVRRTASGDVQVLLVENPGPKKKSKRSAAPKRKKKAVKKTAARRAVKRVVRKRSTTTKRSSRRR